MDIRTTSTVNETYMQALMDRNFTSTKTEITRRVPVHTLQVLLLFSWGHVIHIVQFWILCNWGRTAWLTSSVGILEFSAGARVVRATRLTMRCACVAGLCPGMLYQATDQWKATQPGSKICSRWIVSGTAPAVLLLCYRIARHFTD
jgi:hypothetical protein